jgi:hypothetical protein
VLNLVHENLDSSVETGGDSFVEHVLKALLLAYDAVEEVGPVDVGSLEEEKKWRERAEEEDQRLVVLS